MTESNKEALRSAFDKAAADYDSLRRMLIPHFDAFYGTALDLLEEAMESRAFRCVDLGVGTGLLSELILKRFPLAEIEGIDFSSRMIEAGLARLAPFGTRMRFSIADYGECPLPAPVDAVVSALSIHHLEDAAKRALFRRIHARLVPAAFSSTPTSRSAASPRSKTPINVAGKMTCAPPELAKRISRRRESARNSTGAPLSRIRSHGSRRRASVSPTSDGSGIASRCSMRVDS